MNWGMLFLQEGKGYSMAKAGSILSVYPVAALGGAALSGVVSDRLFGSRRNVPALLVGLAEAGTLVALAASTAGRTWCSRPWRS